MVGTQATAKPLLVLEGEVTLVLEDFEVTLGHGNVVVQRGTDHARANPGRDGPDGPRRR